MLSRCGVWMIWFPLKPTSPQPRSSHITKMMLGCWAATATCTKSAVQLTKQGSKQRENVFMDTVYMMRAALSTTPGRDVATAVTVIRVRGQCPRLSGYGCSEMVGQLRQREIEAGLQELGLRAGDVTLVHSAMRTLGRVDGGASTVVEALLKVLGPSGTLIVPTFTFAHEAEDEPVIDPAADPSEMGAITEAARCHPLAKRSTAFRHSFAAIGKWSTLMAATDPALSPFDLRSAFGVMAALNTRVVLLGVTYASSTSHHFAEYVCEVPYRHTLVREVKVRAADRSESPQTMVDYQPRSEGGSYYGSRGPDFNRLGKMLEDRGLVDTAFIGNAAVRRFAMRELLDLAREEAAQDFNVFRTPDGESDNTTQLSFGRSVQSPQLIDAAGRPHHVQWCVKDLDRLVMPE